MLSGSVLLIGVVILVGHEDMLVGSKHCMPHGNTGVTSGGDVGKPSVTTVAVRISYQA